MTDHGNVLDILIYVFDRYMLVDDPDVPEREELAQVARGAATHPRPSTFKSV